MGEPQASEEPYALEIAVNQAIAACDGDLRATIRALIIANKGAYPIVVGYEFGHVA